MSQVQPDQPSRPLLWTGIGTVLGLSLLYAATRQVDKASLIAILHSADLRIATGVICLQLAFVALKAWRWGLLLRFVPGLRFRELYLAVYAGLATNYLIAHVGEVVRSLTIARRRSVSVSPVLASIFVERALDFVALLMLLGIAAAFARDLPEIYSAMSIATVGILVIAIVGLFVLLHPPEWVVRVAELVTSPLPVRISDWFGDQVERSRDGLASIKKPRLMLFTIGVSVVLWLLIVFLIWASSFAVGDSVSLMAATLTFLLVVLGQQLPSSPLQIGTTQLAFTIGLGTDGVVATSAIAASLVFMAFAIIPTLIIGGVCVIRGQLTDLLRLR